MKPGDCDSLTVVCAQCAQYATLIPVSTGVGDRIQIQFRVRDIYFGM